MNDRKVFFKGKSCSLLHPLESIIEKLTFTVIRCLCLHDFPGGSTYPFRYFLMGQNASHLPENANKHWKMSQPLSLPAHVDQV